MEIKNLKKASDRILKAVKDKERIVIYGDADMDGFTAVIILKEAIKNLGGEVSDVYFPDRETEGYGINEQALEYLKPIAPALLIALDCGIGSIKEVEIAKKMGFEVMIIDHHKILDKMPKASIIVDLHQKGDKYPFKEFATAGVVFKLIEVMLGDKLSNSLRDNFLELVALATLADMMVKYDENSEFMQEGFNSIKNTFRPGLKVFWQIEHLSYFDKGNINQFVQKIISACHAGGKKDHVNEGYLLLISTSLEEAESLAKSLLEKARIRQLKIREGVEEIKDRVSKKMEDSIIFEENDDWKVLMLGPLASKVCHYYKRPVFLCSKKGDSYQGAVRTPAGVDGVKAMKKYAKILDTFGGHPQAGGFKVKEENLEKFREGLMKYFENLA